VNADGKTAVLPRRAFPIDLAISSDNQYLYVLEKKLPGIAAFQIQPDGNLIQIQAVPGTPTSSLGMTGY
jgi:6-phosphogluconolactonase (cycloisomerase 2 family)